MWSKSKEISWGEAQQQSFKKLKVALVAAPILDIVDPNEPFLLETDASGNAIGAILMQGGHPVAFESKKVDRAHQNYFGLWARVVVDSSCSNKWWRYLYGATYKVWTDHKSLKWLFSQKELTGKKACWTLILQEFDM